MYKALRNKYDSFIFEKIDIDNSFDSITCTYTYKLGEYTFNPKVTILKKYITNKNINNYFLYYLFFNYGMVDLINYYKLTLAKKIIIKCGYLDDNQIYFFKKLIYNGLGEYFYINKINLSFEEFVDFDIQSTNKFLIDKYYTGTGNLIPIGGGKDSIVTTELLKKYKSENSFFMLERNIYPQNKAGYESIYTAGYTDNDIFIFNVTLDNTMLELNKQGFLNGHIPFSSQISFASYIMAYLNNKKYIVLSNESSASEGNKIGTTLNHQYSKSIEYETDFRKYVLDYLIPSIEYFSLLRPWSEYQIVKYFVNIPKYLKIFRSCNRGTKTNSWCGKCSKCLYVYIMLSPFIELEELVKIFGNDMLDDMDNKNTFDKLVLQDTIKPFECVGTKKEINYALMLSLKKNETLPKLLKYYKNECYDKTIKYDLDNYFNTNNYVPEKYLKEMIDYDKR